jgi:hypothetical protein
MTKAQLKELEDELRTAADKSYLKPSAYSIPVLGIIFLRFADNNYRRHEPAILQCSGNSPPWPSSRSTSSAPATCSCRA